MLILGFKTITKGLGRTEDDYSSVSHQRCEIITSGNSQKELEDFYAQAVKKAQESKTKWMVLEDGLEYSDISEKEYERLDDKYRKETNILKYERVIIVEGTVLK